MALTDENSGGFNVSMPVQPMSGIGNYGYPVYMGGNNGGLFGNGGDSWLGILFLIALCNGGWGGFGGFGGGFGGWGMMNGFEFPWLLNGQQNVSNNVSDGFRTAQLQDSVTSVRDGIAGLSTQLCNCCGDMQMSLANGFAGVNSNLCNGFNGVNNSIFGAQTALSQQLNANEIANLNRSFAEQTANTAGFTATNTGIADLKYTVATENCADRQALSDGIRDLLAATQAQTQTILTQLCNDKIESKNDTIAQLRQELLYARGQASQDVQTARILAGQTAEVDALYNRLDQCPVGTTPVYGRTPIFSCNNNGCGCGNGFAN